MENTLQAVSSSRLRTMLVIADRRIDRSRDRTEAVAMANRIRNRFNEYAEEHGEVGFEIKPQSGMYQSVVRVEVLGFDDGMWAYTKSVHLPNSGSSGPFDIWDVRQSKREAIRAGVGNALRYMSRCEQNASAVNEKRVAKMAITEMRRFLTEKVQTTLF